MIMLWSRQIVWFTFRLDIFLWKIYPWLSVLTVEESLLMKYNPILLRPPALDRLPISYNFLLGCSGLNQVYWRSKCSFIHIYISTVRVCPHTILSVLENQLVQLSSVIGQEYPVENTQPVDRLKHINLKDFKWSLELLSFYCQAQPSQAKLQLRLRLDL